MKRRNRLKAYIQAVTILGVFVTATVLIPPQFVHGWTFLAYLGVVAVTSTIKIKLPGLTSTLSPNIIPILDAIATLSASEAVLTACAGTLIQCLWQTKRPRFVQLSFNVAVTAIAAGSSGTALSAVRKWPATGEAVGFAVLALVYFVMNSLPVCTAIALSERKRLTGVWTEVYASSLPAFMFSAVAAGVFAASGASRWILVAALAPLLYLVYHAHWIFLARLQREKSTSSESLALNLRTMEALVAAIEARDGAKSEEVRLVRECALETGKLLELPEDEMRALAAAALLRDIGKMAIPDHLLAKPESLAPEELEKVQSHVSIAAAILEPVDFPFPVLPIVQAHHERWDGAGYPNGLEGEAIPRGARILGAVDALVSLTSDRPYRAAVSVEEALAVLAAESGRAFDPAVVEALQRRYGNAAGLGAEVRRAPAEAEVPLASSGEAALDAFSSIQRAHFEEQILAPSDTFLTLKESLAVFALRLHRVVPYDTLAVHLENGDVLAPEYVIGEEARILAGGEVPLGEGISGMVSVTGKSLLNADPAAEFAALGQRKHRSSLHAAVSVPLESATGRRGVLTLYRGPAGAFAADDLRVLLAIRLRVLNWELHSLASATMLVHCETALK